MARSALHDYNSYMNHAGVSVPALPPNVTMSILHVAHLIEDRTDAALATVGLSMAKQSALTKLVEAGEALTLSELAARLSCVRSNMTQLVDRLEADGFVRRVNDPTDRRVVRAELTPLGAERQAQGARLWKTAEAELLASLSEDDARELSALLMRFR